MRLLCIACLLILLVGCESRQAETAAQVPPREKQPSQQLPVVSVAVSPADTIDCLRPHRAPEPGPADTLITIGSQHYWLSMRVSTDSTRAIDYDPAVNAGGAFATPGDTAALASQRVRGYVIRRFSLTPSGAATNVVPHVWVKPAGTYFLYQENTKLVLVPKAAPERLAELPLKSLAKFKPPLRPHEKCFVITTDFSRLELYVDTLHPQQVRYKLGRPKSE
jgi:hypothetical protein